MRHIIKTGLFAVLYPNDASNDGNPLTYSWGNNRSGQLGLGSEVSVAFPHVVEDLKREKVHSIWTSSQCNSSTAITEKGEVLTWGSGLDNILGHNLNESNVLIPTSANLQQSFKKIAPGGGHMLALTNDGRVWSWGLDDCGQCGQEIIKKSGNARDFRPSVLRGRSPGQVLNIESRVVDISSGKYFSLALTESGEVLSWGMGREYALGHNSRDTIKVPTKISSLSSSKIIQISAGRNFAVALDDQGNVFSWGTNDYGQLGQGQTDRFKSIPEKVRFLSNVVQIACGDFHVLALTSSGEVYSWGSGSDGQLGIGTTSNQSTPTLIKSLPKISKINCGGGHSGFITSDFQLLMCGRGVDGQLGRQGKNESVASSRLLPVEVDLFSNSRVLQFAGGAHHSLALVIGK
jgi:alpha-tubulin suppressor-like RCC1 family protein